MSSPDLALRRFVGAAVLCAVLLGSGCARRDAPMPTGVSYRTTPRAGEPLRIAILPIQRGEGIGRSAGSLDEALAASLRGLGRHETVIVDRDSAQRLSPGDPLAENRIDGAVLLALRDRTGADAVLFARCDSFAAYDPLSAALTAHLVSTSDGAVLWSATAHLDGGDAAVQADIQTWHDATRGTGQPSIGGWQNVLISPSRFARYCCDRILGTIPPPTPRTRRIPILGLEL